MIARVLFGLIFASAGTILLGFAMAMYYEGFAFFTRKVPTISAITAEQLLAHPHWFVTGVFMAGILLGALVTHFTHWTP